MSMDIPQLACLLNIPAQTIIYWRCQQLRLPGHGAQAWSSPHCLFGNARFCMRIYATTKAIYFGAKALDTNRRWYVRIEDPGRETCRYYMGVTGSPAVECPKHRLVRAIGASSSAHVFHLRWQPREMELTLNGFALGRVVLRNEVPDAPLAFSPVFIWILSTSFVQEDSRVTPLLTPITTSGTRIKLLI